MKILVLQNHLNSGAAYLLEPAAVAGAGLDIRRPNVCISEKLPANDDGYDGFMLLGGVMNAGDVGEHPWLEEAANLVRIFTKNKKPVLGICLGAQIIARSFGADVYNLSKPEIGYYELKLTDDARQDPLLAHEFATPIFLAEFHQQTFEIPKSAVLLMHGKSCKNQAFKIGNATYAFQPHLEITPELITEWIRISTELVNKYVPDLPSELPDLLKKYHYGSHDFCWKVGSSWFDLVTHYKQIS